jgi:hypothetical protein
MQNSIPSRLAATLESQRGVLFAEPALVGRENYSGRDILAPNSQFIPEFQDERGYLTVERWIMSLSAAVNRLPRAHEGISRLRLTDGEPVLLTEAAAACGERLFGSCLDRWPLVKLLDIGGAPVVPSYGGAPEAPPITFHVHSGEIVNGRAQGPGKLEAYFFPPLDLPPYNQDPGRVISRLGVRPRVTREDVLAALGEFGDSDAMYALGQPYEVRPYDGWIIHPGCLHAPGPWPTIEVQVPQDDYNLAAWRFGERVADPAARRELWRAMGLRGLADERDFLAQVVDWELSADPEFEKKYRQAARTLESGSWGRRLQIFFEMFYGEALEIEPGAEYRCPASPEPWTGLVWSGAGSLNGMPVGADYRRSNNEFLVTPGHEALFHNSAAGERLVVYRIFPYRIG